MDPTRWQEVKALFARGVTMEEEARRAWLDELATDDADLAAEVSRLLALDAESGSLFDKAVPMLSCNGIQDFVPGTEIGHFTIQSMVGEGGMGIVYRARQKTPIDRIVALKVIKPGLLSREIRNRFDHERRAVALMNHANIARILEAGTTPDGRPYFAMEYVEGRPLNEVLANFTLPQRLELLLQVCSAVAYAHRQGIIHRDLTPANLLVECEPSPNIKIIDFGIAKAANPHQGNNLETRAGDLIGTPSYMSPEQISGELAIDTRTDIYALGVLLYECLCGEPPFDPRQPVHELLRNIQSQIPEKPSTRLHTNGNDPSGTTTRVPTELEWIAFKAMEKEPERRYQNVDAFAADIRRFQENRPISVGPPHPLYRARKFVHRFRAAISIAALVTLALFTGGGLAVMGHIERIQTRERLANYRVLAREVERIDSIMETAYLAPLRDLSRERGLVNEHIGQWRDLLRSNPDESGTLHYALGRAHLALSRYPEAISYLQEAERRGFQDGMLSYSLGIAHGRLFWERKQELSVLPRKRAVDEEKKLRATLLDPAFHYLQRAPGTFAPSPAFLQALRAFYDDRGDDALSHLDTVLAEKPWFYEAHLLRGEIHAAFGQDKRDKGKRDQAHASYARALEAFDQAARIARSHPRAYLGIVHTLSDRMVVDRSSQSGTLESDALSAYQYLDKARTALPDSTRAHLLEAITAMRHARHIARKGEDPASALDRVWSATGSYRIDYPESFAPHYIRGVANVYASIYANTSGGEPEPHIEESLAAFRSAIEVAPEHLPSLHGLAEAYVYQSNILKLRGKDPTESIQSALDVLAKASRIAPESAEVWDTLGQIYFQLGHYQSQQDQDPFAAYTQAHEAGTRAREIEEGPIFSYNNGLYRLGFAISAVKFDKPWREPLRDAIELFTHAISLQPQYSRARGQLGLAWLTHAEQDYKEGNDAGKAVAAATEALEETIRIKPKNHLAFLNLAQLHMLLARHDTPEAAQAHRQKAESLLAKALANNPKYAETHYARAILSAERQNQEAALNHLEQATALNPTYHQKAKNDVHFKKIHHRMD